MTGSPSIAWMRLAAIAVVLSLSASGTHAAEGPTFPAQVLQSQEVRGAPAVDEQEIARTVMALYDSRREPDLRRSRIHRLVDMPVNHLGFVIWYHDIAQGLPKPNMLSGIRAVVTFFDGPVPNPGAYADWASGVLDQDIRYVILGDLGMPVGGSDQGVALDKVNGVLRRIGIEAGGRYVSPSYRTKALHKNPWMVEFERPLNGMLPGFDIIRAVGPKVQVHLALQVGDDAATRSDVVAVGPSGGYVAPGYAFHYDPSFNRMQWRINPFEFFRSALLPGEAPIPDTTTVVGRRIYYSHIDGDGWRSLSELYANTDDRRKAAEVVMTEAIIPYPDLPVTVAPVVADLHPDWDGDDQDREIARQIFRLPQVEAGSHTWTHPLDWEFFENYDQEAEQNYVAFPEEYRKALIRIELGYPAPRSFFDRPFVLDQEIAGSVDYINGLLPSGKRTRIVQWSGDASPFEAALAATAGIGLPNINGPDNRFDEEYSSYAYLTPVGIRVGSQLQIYSSASNESAYTDIWTRNFFGFRHLDRTVLRTETPYRVKPFNIYYHMYSGSKPASLNALLANLDLARKSRIAPVSTSNYASIAQGFYTARMISLGDRRWRIEDRGSLQTVRFDRASFTSVDFDRSTGILGQIHHQGSLYVSLDPAEAVPMIALRDVEDTDRPAVTERPYLQDSRWLISDLSDFGKGWAFTAEGYGAGEMVWRARPGTYLIRLQSEGTEPTVQTGASSAPQTGETKDSQEPASLPPITVSTDEFGVLSFTLDADAIDPIRIFIEPTEGS